MVIDETLFVVAVEHCIELINGRSQLRRERQRERRYEFEMKLNAYTNFIITAVLSDCCLILLDLMCYILVVLLVAEQ